MHYTRGKSLGPEIKMAIISIKSYFDRNKPEIGMSDSSAQMTADALGIGIASVDRVMASYRKDPDSLNNLPQLRGRRAYSVDLSHQAATRAYIRQANIEGTYISLETIRKFLHEREPKESFHISTLARTLDRWGFEFGKGIRTQHLKEKDHVIAARQRYLRKMRNNRLKKAGKGTKRPEVYLDESYVNKNHSNDFIWHSNADAPWVQKPTGKGERLIIINAITKGGWVPNAKVVFKSTRKTGDYHGQMNNDLFKKWFTDKLLPNIPDNALIVMDNASYHNLLAEHSAPTPVCSKERIKTWLETNKLSFREDCLKVELVEALKKVAPEPTYVIDEIAWKQGHEVIRTPPYHPELQPIEICWGVLKNQIARHCDFTMDGLQTQLDNAFEEITAATCTKIIKKVKAIEDKFWTEDIKLDRSQ